MNWLQKAGIAAGVVKDAGELAQDLQLVARNFFIEAEHPVLGKTPSDSTPIRLSRTPAHLRRAAPLLGQDNHYVFHQLLGLSEEQLSKYIKDGTIG